jgi:hypothetical protein
MPYFISHFYKSPAQSLALSAQELSIASATSFKGIHQWRNTTRVDCFVLLVLSRSLRGPIPSSRTKLCMSQRLLRITLSPVNKTPRVCLLAFALLICF